MFQVDYVSYPENYIALKKLMAWNFNVYRVIKVCWLARDSGFTDDRWTKYFCLLISEIFFSFNKNIKKYTGRLESYIL